MSTAVPTQAASFLPDEWKEWTYRELQEYLDGIPASRIRIWPPPGHATEEDAMLVRERTGRLCELVDGILVEKPMGWFESRIAVLISHLIESYLEGNDLGFTLAADGPFRLRIGRMRMPDVSFVSWDHFPGRILPKSKVLPIPPDLAVEVLSESNTRAEMQRKLSEYFASGSRLVWYIDPATRTARAFTAADQGQEIAENGRLSGGDVLPGFELSLLDLFARAGRREGNAVEE